MFTGLVEDVGEVVSVRPRGEGRVLVVRTAIPLEQVALGDSVAVNGACLTVASKEASDLRAVVGRETVERTTLGGLRAGERVHLERALALGDRLGGHLVQGHVDGVGEVASVRDLGESWVVWIEVPRELTRYVVEKGSLCVDGVSLTVNEIKGGRFRLNLVPHTIASTCLGARRPGDRVNLEVDILAKYVERLLRGAESGKGLSLESLKRNGFT